MREICRLSFMLLLVLSIFGCKSLVNKLAFHPDRVNVIPTNELPVGVREITTRTRDGIQVTSLYLPSSKSDKVVIYFHGNAGNIYHRLPSLLKIQQFGVSVIGLSYRGYGKSEGSPTESGVYLDGEAIFQYVVNQLEYKENNIILFGRSIGTTVAVNTAHNRNLRGIILATPLTSGKDQAEAVGLGLVSSLAGNSFDNISKINTIRSPLLVIHGTNDKVIPYSMGKKLFEQAKVNKKFVTIEGANHNNLENEFGEQYWQPIFRFMKNV